MQNELEVKIVSSVTEANKKLDQLISKLNGVSKSTKNTINDAGKIGKAFNLGATYVGAKKLFNMMNKMAKESIDYSESLNLFNVVFKNIEKDGIKAFSELGREATQFQNKLNEAFGTNQSESLNYHAIFQSMAESMNITRDYAGIMSENSTKLIYDISSLFNDSEKNVGEALRAGIYAGQTKPLRKYGYDITQQTLQPILDQFEIKNSDGTLKTVKQLSQAEKQILRYIAVLKQSANAQGDWANTIESPANQLKIMNNQLKETSRALGNLFVGAYAKMLPYVNAILMVVKEVANAIADMFGIKISDYNSGIASSEDLSDSYDDVADSVGGATQAVKELKRETLSFDQIHNINENKDNGSGGGSSVSGGIDQRLLDAIKGYDNGMDKVRMKATQIRDKIMEWLGFTKEIDEKTGKVSWKFTNTNSILYKIAKALKKIFDNGKKAISNVFNVLKKDFDNGMFGKVIVNVLDLIGDALGFISRNKTAQTVLARILEILIGYKTLKLLPGFNLLMDGIKKQIPILDTLKDKVAKVGVGFAELVIGYVAVKSSMESIADEGLNLANSLTLVGGAISNIAGGAQIGSIFGTPGKIIGSCAGAIITVIEALSGYKEATKKASEETQKYEESLKRLDDTTRNKLETNIAVFDNNERMVDELGKLVDANGKVKKSDEERVNYILNELNKAYDTEYELINGRITLNGKEVKSIQKVQDEIKEKIKWMKLEAVAEAYKNDYLKLLKDEKTLTETSVKAHEAYEKMQKQIIDRYGERNLMLYNQGLLHDEVLETQIESDLKMLKSVENTVNGMDEKLKETKKGIKNYEEFSSAILSKNYETALKLGGNYYNNTEDMQDLYTQKTKDGFNNLVTNLGKTFNYLPKEKKLEIKADTNSFLTKVKSALDKYNKKTIDIDANTNSLTSKLKSAFGNTLSSIFGFNIKAKADGGIYSNGHWHNIAQYANGGLPPTGQMFIAREKGPELVGKIGSSTAVMNNAQIVESVKAGVYQAVSSAMSQYGGSNVSLDIRTEEGIIVKKAINGINKIKQTTGECPIDVW